MRGTCDRESKDQKIMCRFSIGFGPKSVVTLGVASLVGPFLRLSSLPVQFLARGSPQFNREMMYCERFDKDRRNKKVLLVLLRTVITKFFRFFCLKPALSRFETAVRSNHQNFFNKILGSIEHFSKILVPHVGVLKHATTRSRQESQLGSPKRPIFGKMTSTPNEISRKVWHQNQCCFSPSLHH